MVNDLIRDWTFLPSKASRYFRRQRIKDFLFHLHLAPPKRILRKATPAPEWILYFMFLPDGKLAPSHRFTLQRLMTSGMKLLIVCATAQPSDIPADVRNHADALIWKALPGFDFSAYAAGLWHLAATSPGANVLVLNDSVLGPFVELKPFMARTRWDLTGFTASQYEENHIQSYAFILRDVTRWRLLMISTVLPKWLSFHRFDEIVRSQETRFARVAAHHMSVGAFWFASDDANKDPTLFTAGDMLDDGYPFIKRSAVGKFRHVLPPGIVKDLDERLAAFSHPAIG
jgi:lipopolysaccharide biosynthesis protein